MNSVDYSEHLTRKEFQRAFQTVSGESVFGRRDGDRFAVKMLGVQEVTMEGMMWKR